MRIFALTISLVSLLLFGCATASMTTDAEAQIRAAGTMSQACTTRSLAMLSRGRMGAKDWKAWRMATGPRAASMFGAIITASSA